MMKRFLWLAGVAGLLVGCGRESAELERGYDTMEEVLGMPECRGEIVWASPCSIKLRTQEGREVWIGSPSTKDALGGFVVGRENGERMVLPGDFVEWLEERE